MFAPPSVRDFVDPAESIDLMQRYVLTLISVTDEGVSPFAKDKNDPAAEHSIKWVWQVATSNNVVLLQPDGSEWEMWEWTGNRTGRKKDGSPSKARERLEALVGRELNDDEITKVPIQNLPGRKVHALFHRVKTTAADGSDVERTKILKVAPLKGPSLARAESLENGATPRMAGAAAASATKAGIPDQEPFKLEDQSS